MMNISPRLLAIISYYSHCPDLINKDKRSNFMLDFQAIMAPKKCHNFCPETWV